MKTKTATIPRRWAWHYRALVRLGQALASESGERSAAIRETVERGGSDSGDAASEEFEHETLLAEIRKEQAELAEVDAALDRIRDGTYGVCQLTGQPIEAARLRAVPWTRYSTTAAAKLEQSSGKARPRA